MDTYQEEQLKRVFRELYFDYLMLLLQTNTRFHDYKPIGFISSIDEAAKHQLTEYEVDKIFFQECHAILLAYYSEYESQYPNGIRTIISLIICDRDNEFLLERPDILDYAENLSKKLDGYFDKVNE